jgi:SAM-dependent methyltransferase
MTEIDPADPEHGSPAWWDARYDNGETPWDTGIVPPELVALVESGLLTPGWALDLGCGSGVSSRYLARHGFRVAGVDIAQRALARAAAQARAEALPASFLRGDVADLSFLRLTATFALDVGCFHSLLVERKLEYVASLTRHLAPGGYYLLYAFGLTLNDEGGASGVGPSDLVLFAPGFQLCSVQHGVDRERASAWYLWQRSGEQVTSSSLRRQASQS